MIPRPFRILYPTPPVVVPAATVEDQDTGEGGTFRPTSPVSEHARLTDGTADLWRQLVHLCWETPT